MRLLTVSLLSFLLSGFFAMQAAAQSTYSIRGVNVPGVELGKAYEKAVDRYVFGEGLRKPVTESDYVKAWETYRRDQEKREQEKRDRDRALQDQYRNRNNPNSYNRNTYNRRNSATTTVKAGTGISVRDKTQPKFVTIKGVVIKPGRRDATIQDEDGNFYVVSGDVTLTKTGRAQTFKLKVDPDGRTKSFRGQSGLVEAGLYENYTLTPQEFVKQLRAGEMTSLLPALGRGPSTKSGFGTGPANQQQSLGNTRSAPDRKGTSGFGGRSFGSSGGSLSGGSSSRGGSSLGQRTEGSGFSRRTTTLKR